MKPRGGCSDVNSCAFGWGQLVQTDMPADTEKGQCGKKTGCGCCSQKEPAAGGNLLRGETCCEGKPAARGSV